MKQTDILREERTFVMMDAKDVELGLEHIFYECDRKQKRSASNAARSKLKAYELRKEGNIEKATKLEEKSVQAKRKSNLWKAVAQTIKATSKEVAIVLKDLET